MPKPTAELVKTPAQRSGGASHSTTLASVGRSLGPSDLH
jgi:hypothetical protein